jgi:hypothetical protein
MNCHESAIRGQMGAFKAACVLEEFVSALVEAVRVLGEARRALRWSLECCRDHEIAYLSH